MSDEDFQFDVDLLICAIEDCPIIWDKGCYEYKCRVSTAGAWREVCQRVNPKFEDMDSTERQNFVQLTMKKWRNVRDTWRRAQRRLADGERVGSGTKVVMYQEQLSFLECTLGSDLTGSDCMPDKNDETKDSAVSFILDTNSDGDGKDSALPSTTSIPGDTDGRCSGPAACSCSGKQTKKRKKDHSISLEAQILETLEKIGEQEVPKRNRHLHFFEGILPSLDEFDEEDTLEFQSEVINLVQKIRRKKYL